MQSWNYKPNLSVPFGEVALAMEAFKQAQDRWCERLISDEDLCDAVALVGPERHRVPFIRAHLATLSEPLKAALYGDFREGHTGELILEDVTVDALDVMIRSAYHLEPKLTPLRALHAFTAARLYMIDDLEKYCLDYLQNSKDLDCTAALQIFTESLKASLSLPEELQQTYWSILLAKSEEVVQSPFFVETHGSIISKWIKLEEFRVNEETLWDRLVEWSAAALQKPELLGPFAAAMGSGEVAQHDAILRLMSPYIRFTQMRKDFFVDKVREHLDRRQSERVMDYFLLNRNSEGLLINQRVGLTDPVAAKADKLSGAMREVRKLTFSEPKWFTMVELSWSRVVSVGFPTFGSWPWSVCVDNKTYSSRQMTSNQMGLCSSTILVTIENPCNELTVAYPPLGDDTKVIVFGTNATPPFKLAQAAVQRLSTELRFQSTDTLKEGQWQQNWSQDGSGKMDQGPKAKDCQSTHFDCLTKHTRCLPWKQQQK